MHLQSDRSLEFHTPEGCHYTTRLPRYGRDLLYEKRSAEALIPSVGVNQDGMGEVFRLNLELGRYMRGYEVDVGGDDFTSAGGGALQGGINTGSVNTGAIAEESHNLLAFGTSIGTVELWDSRARGRAGILLPPSDSDPNDDGRPEITALEFNRSGLTLGTGSSNGLIFLYDLRSPAPLLKKDQGYGYPIHTLNFLAPSSSSRQHLSEPKILSSDKRIIKLWDERDGTPWTSVEPAVDINSVAWCKDSGMILTANEGKQQHAFFVPQLGPAPKWCSFLDNLVEEMADDPNDPNAFTSNQGAGTVYDNYKFLTPPQLRTLNLDHLIGRTNLLRPYMHGYFVAQRLYEEARLITNPYIWEEERARKVNEKIDAERESRIRGKKKINTKVNKKLAEKLVERDEKNERRKAQRALDKAADEVDETVGEIGEAMPAEPNEPTEAEPIVSRGLLADERFTKLFEDEEFAVDETSREFQSLNPSTRPDQPSHSGERGPRGLTAVEQDALDEVPGSSSDDDDGSDENDTKPKTTAKPAATGRISNPSYKRNNAKRQPQMQVSSSTKKGGDQIRDRSFATRVEKSRGKERSFASRGGSAVGEKEVTFAPQGKSKGPRRGQPDRAEGGGRENFRSKERRSASGNAFRRM